MAECFWASPPALAEVMDLRSWGVESSNPEVVDAGELAKLAAAKWEATNDWGDRAASLKEIQDIVAATPKAEVTGMLLAGAHWFPGGLLGVCLFHRTWPGNVFVDFLAANPAAIASTPRVTGVGYGLMCFLCEAAIDLGAPILWGETTPASVRRYRIYFESPNLDDRLVVTSDQMRAFTLKTRQVWRGVRLP